VKAVRPLQAVPAAPALPEPVLQVQAAHPERRDLPARQAAACLVLRAARAQAEQAAPVAQQVLPVAHRVNAGPAVGQEKADIRFLAKSKTVLWRSSSPQNRFLFPVEHGLFFWCEMRRGATFFTCFH
jgi:hypothetical protein